MPTRESAQPTQYGVDHRRIVGIERNASDESAWKIAGDVGEVQARGHKSIGGKEHLCSDGDNEVIAVAWRDVHMGGR